MFQTSQNSNSSVMTTEKMRPQHPKTLSIINEHERFNDGLYNKACDRTPSPCIALPKTPVLPTILEGESTNNTKKKSVNATNRDITTGINSSNDSNKSSHSTKSIKPISITNNAINHQVQNKKNDDNKGDSFDDNDINGDTHLELPYVDFDKFYNFGDPTSPPGLDGVKAMANRLKLSTRRQSYQKWCEKYIGSSGVPRFPPLTYNEATDGKLTDDRKEGINNALGWIKTELEKMRDVDHTLATQLLSLRSEIQKLKLERSCENHQELLEDVKDELSERETLLTVCDIPYDMDDENPLKQIGLTRMNISSRRFSTC
ncbi:Hypothetical predicted protein [Octopus vulgaris]|uniref:Uncharacterized protein n=1 Tax=Octopus vulgaris TaxID=6645 RepID=A0AA36AMV3_OCTVU|nr:Hypothetical predicted protein [Octopus vulgaris]